MGNWHLLVLAWSLFTFLTSTNCSKYIQPREEKGYKPRIDVGSRLPKDVVPSKYVIAISPDFPRDEFHGAVQIDFNVLQPRNYVALHANNLTIGSTKLYHYESLNNYQEVTIRSVYPVEKYEMLIIEVFKPIMGEYSLTVNFSASLIGKIDGFYLSTYHDDSKVESTRKLAATQFEPVYARKAFPCFDEPGFKSEFHIRLVCSSSSGYHALSNMPPVKIERSTNNSDLVITTFAPSLPMSTYLVAFVISDFVSSMSSIDSLNGTRIPISIYTRPSNKGKVQFALNVATRATEFYMNVFGIDYSLPKIDLVAVPDFEAGAMENWGLITFRETDVIYSANHSSCRNIKSVSLTIAHELAHMWFGNLVTLKWWEDLWLNEGFATYMEHVAVDFIFPDWNQMGSFPLETKYVTMLFDGKASTRSIIQETKNSDEIGQMFDHISYQKGAAIIRMLEDAMGKHKFIYGIRWYLKMYKYGNAATDQLFDILQRHVQDEINILEFMNSWTKYPGFPIINVQRDGKVLRLSQKRFIANKRLDYNSKQTWNIPIKYITNEMKDGIQFGWFLANASCVELAVKESVKWIKLNHNSVGYYVVNYTEDGWNTFSSLLFDNLQVLSPLNRADILHNAFLLADATDLSYLVALNLTSFLLDESALQPWVVTANWLVQTDRLISGTDLYLQFQRYAQTLVNTIYKKVGWTVKESDPFTRRELRTVILKLACSVGHENCLDVAKNRLKKLIDSNGTQKPHPDIRSVVYSYGLVPLGVEAESMFNQMWKLFLCESDVQEKERLMIGLANVRDTKILKRYLEMARNEKFVRRQNYFEVAVKVALNPKGLDLVWDFVKSNWENLVKKYTLSDFAMGKAVGTIISLFKNEGYLEEAKVFFRKYPEAGVGANARRDALEEVTNNINWLDNNVDIIRRWLKTNGFYSNE